MKSSLQCGVPGSEHVTQEMIRIVDERNVPDVTGDGDTTTKQCRISKLELPYPDASCTDSWAPPRMNQ
jgi:hypothetical protein